MSTAHSRSRASLLSTVAALALAGGCANSYSMVGYDLATTGKGAVAGAVGDGADGNAGTFAAGFGAGAIAVEAVVHGHDLETSADRWLSASGGLELKVRLLQLGPTQTFVHGGAMRAMLLDREQMDLTWGVGYSYGATFAAGKGGVRGYVDYHVEELTYTGSVISGAATISTATTGLMLGR